MARSRNIKPAFFNNDELAEIDPLGRLFFIGLWTIADYQGSFIWREKRLKAMILPYDNCDVKKFAINLDKSGFIQFYTDGVEIYAKIVNFELHQNPHKNERAKGSDIPKFDESSRQAIDFKGLTIKSDNLAINPDLNDSDRADSLLLIPDSLLLKPEPLQESLSSGNDSVKKVIESYNEIIDSEKPNWQKCKAENNKRSTLIKSALKLVEQRAKITNQTNFEYLVNLLEAMANDLDFFSGKPTQRNPQGFNCSFETNFTQTRISQAIDKFAGE